MQQAPDRRQLVYDPQAEAMALISDALRALIQNQLQPAYGVPHRLTLEFTVGAPDRLNNCVVEVSNPKLTVL